MLQALRGQVTQYTPIWLMRQAGRYLPEYRALRAEAGSFLKLCYNPSMAVEITLQPLRRFDLDAAILFSDILVIPHALGQGLDFVEGEGPILPPLETLADFDLLDISGFEQKLAPVYETLSRLKEQLPPEKTLIGFAGAPWTVACYMLHGRGGGKFERATETAAADPQGFKTFLLKLADVTADYLISQIKHGADTVQIFDSWAALVPDEYFHDRIIAPTARIVSAIKAVYPDVPIIGFPRQAGRHYADYAGQTGISALGLDPQADISAMPKNICLQGNLDPQLLLTGGEDMQRAVTRIMDAASGRPFIFNLGHGVIKETPPEHVAALISLVRQYKRAI
ncbi:MAG: uroporphyrinogen decarboxylase [Alphaproteobacteria bacterium]|nr:uroporphyrinogen decarboxylase [Alphaproteobacteria bacterium]